MPTPQNKLNISITSCLECEHHKVLPDPDPNDSFNYDDVMIICKKMPCEAYNLNSTRACDNVLFKTIDVMCRPCQLPPTEVGGL